MTTGLEYLAALPGYDSVQKEYIKSQFSVPGNIKKLSEATTQREFNDDLVKVIGTQAAAKPGLLFLGFKSTEQAKVDSIADGFDRVATLIASGLVNVGKYGRFGSSSTPYELLFGAHALRSGDSYRKRATKVTEVLTAIRDSLAERWVINRSAGNDIASWSSGKKIEIGTGWKGSGMFSAGVLLHELGHTQGLVDVCDQAKCCGPFIDLKHYKDDATTELLNCRSNSAHGGLAPRSGHFIGLGRSKLLATTQKNLTVWNADSYRWYCSYFHRGEIDASAPGRIVW